MDEREHLKREIVAELRAGQLRFWRNAAALAGLALAVGCTTALHPLTGGIVAGTLLAVMAVMGMFMARPKPEPELELEQKEGQKDA